MWSRDFEIALGLWLAMSPFVFRDPGGDAALFVHDLVCGAIVVTLSLFAYWRRTARAHLLQLVVALWLTGFGWVGAMADPLPTTQNRIVVGLLLGMFAIVPNQASRPPAGWREPERE